MAKKKTKAQAPKKRGAPSKYDKDYHPDRVIELARQGKFLAHTCVDFGIARDTLWRWSKEHPELSDALKVAQEHREVWFTDMFIAMGKGEMPFAKPVPLIFLSKNVVPGWRDQAPVGASDEPEFEVED